MAYKFCPRKDKKKKGKPSVIASWDNKQTVGKYVRHISVISSLCPMGISNNQP